MKIAADNADGLSDIKGAVAAAHYMISNAAKHDVDEQSLVQEIQQLGLPKENADALGRQYREHKELLITALSADSYRHSKLLAVDWRVDQIIASSNGIGCGEESIHVKFTYDSRPEDGEILSMNDDTRVKNFACELSSKKLDILIHELSHATSILENMQT